MRLHPSQLTFAPFIIPQQFLFGSNSTAMPALLATDFHEGEAAMRQLLKVPPGQNPTTPGLPPHYAMRVSQSPLLAVGTLDEHLRPWTTLWGGERGFAGPVAPDVLGLSGTVDTTHDPVFEAFWRGADERDAGLVQPNGGEGVSMSALAIDLETRNRVKLAGKMIAGADKGAGGVQAAMHVEESLGNCPKYLNKKVVSSHEPNPQLVSDELPLGQEAVALLGRADMFFLSSTNGRTMDTNHRGGPKGFVMVARNEEGAVELVYPEYSGNRLYQTLGNLKVNPKVGAVVPDFETSDVLYFTGTASILVGQEAASIIGRTQLAVKITVSAARFVKDSLTFRGSDLEASPYNPPLRHLLSERTPAAAVSESLPATTATLVGRNILTPTIAVFTFRLDSREALPAWHAGQHITLDFSPELDHGYSHMRDDEPQSLNDDFVRTFTVSSPPPAAAGGDEVQITARRSGPATGLLWRQNLRAPLELPVSGFGGEASFRVPTAAAEKSGEKQSVFVAGGVGITPLLAQAKGVLDGDVPLELLWSLRGEDIALAEHVFDTVGGLAARTKLFVTGEDRTVTDELERRGVTVERRRLREGDVKPRGGELGKKRYYLCAGPGLLREMLGWLDGEEVAWEDFGY